VRVSAATSGMSTDPAFTNPLNWRMELPVLTGRSVSLREPTALDVDALAALLSLSDATPFGLSEPPGMASAHQVIERFIGDRWWASCTSGNSTPRSRRPSGNAR